MRINDQTKHPRQRQTSTELKENLVTIGLRLIVKGEENDPTELMVKSHEDLLIYDKSISADGHDTELEKLGRRVFLHLNLQRKLTDIEKANKDIRSYLGGLREI